MTRISQQQLESYLWGAATLLRGTIDAGDYKQFIFPLLFYKRLCDVYDEETRAALAESDGDKEFASYPENHRFQIPPEAHWSETRKVAKNVGAALQNALRAIETVNPDKLYGIFGDAQWTNKDRLPDAMLRDLIEHFSSLELTIANLPEDELGNGYEYLIKKFADDAGHTAAEFYTNRTVVHLMTELLQPQPGESVYDPTCGSGGMPLSCVAHLRRQGKEWRNVRIYGQERNLMTSSIARMNCFLHGIEDFRIERGDTLAEPKFVQGDSLQQFDVVLANPPYSIKQWDREAFASDPWGRNLFGTPPQGRADYAFWQHIIKSMDPKTGRCAILFPHGILFRQEEAEMRRKLVEADLIECVIGLGPNLFYNSPMEACVVICRMAKADRGRNRILFIDAVGEVTRERAQSFLTKENIERITNAYQQFEDEPGFTCIASLEQIREHDFSLNIPLYISNTEHRRTGMRKSEISIEEAFTAWFTSANRIKVSLSSILGNIAVELPDLDNVQICLPTWLDRSDWQTYRFDQIAENIRESAMPTPKDSSNYIGLEHMDSGSLHVSRWGSEADLIGQKLRMRKGDILFARRNAYLRRVAIAPHDGLFSAHGMILRAKSDLVLPEFLPLLMLSDYFMNRAVGISVGSLSPTINWTALKNEKFTIPSLDQQRRVAIILWSVDKAIEHLTNFDKSLINAVNSSRDKHFSSFNCNQLTSLRHVGRWSGGNTPSRSNQAYWTGSFPWVSPKDMKQPLIADSEEHLSEAGRAVACEIGPDSILIVTRGMILAHSFPVGITKRYVTINQDMKALVPNASFSTKYLFHWFKWATPAILGRISDSSHGTKRLAMDDLFNMKVPTPTREKQDKFVEDIEALENAETALLEDISQLKLLRMALLNEVFKSL